MTTLTRWLLRALADEWPGGLPGSGDTGGPLRLLDRDESRVLAVDTTTSPTTLTRDLHRQTFDLNTANALGVALTGREDTPAGLGGTEYQVEPTLSIRIEGADEREHGHIADGEEFKELYETALDAVKKIDNGTLQSAPVADFYVAEPGTQSPGMDGYKDYYQYQFDVAPRGYQQL